MPPPKGPTNADVLQAINDLSVTFGAELASARAQIEALTTEVASLKMLWWTKQQAPLGLTPVLMPPELAKLPPLSSLEMQLIKDDKKIDAIKAYRARMEAAGKYAGLKEAKDLVCFVADHMHSKPMFDPANPLPMTQKQKDLVHAGMKIDAIKDYRTYVSTICAGMCGLKEAKDVIEAYAAELQAKAKELAASIEVVFDPKTVTLSHDEAKLLKYVAGQGVLGRFDAVKAFRHRTGASLEAAVKAVDSYIASKTAWIGLQLTDAPTA